MVFWWCPMTNMPINTIYKDSMLNVKFPVKIKSKSFFEKIPYLQNSIIGGNIDTIRFEIRYEKIQKYIKNCHFNEVDLSEENELDRYNEKIFAKYKKGSVYLKLIEPKTNKSIEANAKKKYRYYVLCELYNLSQFNQSADKKTRMEYRKVPKEVHKLINALFIDAKTAQGVTLLSYDFAIDFRYELAPYSFVKDHIKGIKGLKKKERKNSGGIKYSSILLGDSWIVNRCKKTVYIVPRVSNKDLSTIEKICVYDKKEKNRLAFNCIRVEITFIQSNFERYKTKDYTNAGLLFDDNLYDKNKDKKMSEITAKSKKRKPSNDILSMF